MTFSTRRRIFYALVALFFVLGAGVVLYAQGWRFDFATGHVDKIGAIYVRAFPTDASISLNGKPVQSQVGFLSSGTLIGDLFPKIYALKLTVHGYHDWQESVAVSPSLVTELKYAVLVPRDGTSTASATVAFFLASQKKLAAADASNTVATMATSDIIIKKNAVAIGGAAASSSVAIAGANKKITLIRNGLLGILQSDGALYLYDTGARQLHKLADDVAAFSTTDDGSIVATLEQRSVEIFSLNNPTGSDGYYRFNLPYSGYIKQLIWYKDRSHLFVVYKKNPQQNYVAFLDLADAGLNNFTTIATMASGTSPVYDPQTNSLYLIAALHPAQNAVRFDFPQ